MCRWSVDRDGAVTDGQGNDPDTQETRDRDGRPVLVCVNGHHDTPAAVTADVMVTLRIEREGWNENL